MHPKTLYLHSHGPPVRALQLLLKAYEPGLAVDGRFGLGTEHAVRTAQRKLAIFPVDGIAGPHTLSALAKAAKPVQPPASALSKPPSLGARIAGAAQASTAAVAAEHVAIDTLEKAVQTIEAWIAGLHASETVIPASLHPVVQSARPKAQKEPAPPGLLRDPKIMSLSEDGRKFVFSHEAGDGSRTGHLHHPSGHSGVTLGPGYDMKDRKPEAIAADLKAIQVDHTTALAAAKGAGLHDQAATDFAKANHGLLNLSLAQQVQLQRVYKPHYEQMVARAVHVRLHQYEYDALVSFAGNPGTRAIWQTTTRLVNEHKPQQAMAEIFLAIHTGDPKLTPGLINRRKAESRLFLYGDYQH